MNYSQARLVDRVNIKLKEREEQELNKWIEQKRTLIQDSREAFLNRQQKYLFNYDDFITYGRKGPWEGASAKHMPLTAIMVKAYHSRLYNIFSSENTTQLIPREGSDETQVEIAKKLRYWYMWDYLNEYKGIRGFIRELTKDTVEVGFGLGMKDWVSKQRKILMIEPNELSKEMADLEPQLQEKALGDELLQTEEELSKRKISIKPYKEVQKIINVFDGTRLRTIPFENAYFTNNIPESNDLDFPPYVGIVTEMSASEIRLRGEQQEWEMKKAEKIINENRKEYADTRAQNIKQEKGSLTGYRRNSYINEDEESYIIEYAFCNYDIDKDGIAEEIVVTRSEGGTILKITYLDRISPLGVRPLIKFDCFSKSRQAYSRGIPEFMYPLNEEMDETHNMRLNALALQTCPFGTYRATSSLKNQPIKIEPGKFIPTDEVTDLKPFNFNVSAAVLAGEEDRVWHYAERLTSTSSLNQGIVPSTVGPTRSTSGVLTLLQQMDKEFKVTVDQCAEQWEKLEKMCLADLDFKIPTELKMRVLGASVKDYLRKYPENVLNQGLMINAAIDLKIDVASLIRSDEMRRNEAMIILDKLSAPSIAQQFGVLGPKALYKGWEDFLRAYDKEVDLFLDEPIFVTRPLTLYHEIQYFSQENIPPLSMQDDHMGKAQALQMFMQAPEYMEAKQNGLYISAVDNIMIQTIQKHLSLAEALAPKGLPNPSGQNNQDLNATLSGKAPQQKEEKYVNSRNSENRNGPGGPTEKGGMEKPSEGANKPSAPMDT